MKSPRFDIRAAPLKIIFSAENLEKIWKEKVRISMRQQFINDGIEYFDFHVMRELECRKLSKTILSGDYVPEKSQRILVEKDKGLCRQLVIPSARDALVLQALSDALYDNIRGKAPTNRSFFEPKEHRFSSERASYGTYAAWINFQKNLFNFSRSRDYVVVTDIANYYDSISYSHLRNVITRIAGAEECVIDMLIHVLSSLLWQPDYMPAVEIGLPQINIDAPRLLAHCFLYELDEFLSSDKSRDFVRFMDDIDVGADSIPECKKIIKDIDLVLQAKQIRLNAGKTLILTKKDAKAHFMIKENIALDLLEKTIKRKESKGLSTLREQAYVKKRISRGVLKKKFDIGNGNKVLKRLMTFASKLQVKINPDSLRKIFLYRPSIREKVCSYIMSMNLTAAHSEVLASIAESNLLVDNASLVDISNYIVETKVTRRAKIHDNIERIAACCDISTFFGLYCGLWIRSKYSTTSNLIDLISESIDTWAHHTRLGRIIGSLYPLFHESGEMGKYLELLCESRNNGFRDSIKFLKSLESDSKVFDSMYDALRSPNNSRGTGITHPKFLCLLAALRNNNARPERIARLKKENSIVVQDIYYRGIMKRIGVL